MGFGLPGQVPDGPLYPVPAADASSFPLAIGTNGYPLRYHTSTIVSTSVTAGLPVSISVTMFDAAPIAHFVMYLNLQGDGISGLQGGSRVVWDSGDVQVIDPDGLLGNATATLSEDPHYPAKITATLPPRYPRT